MTSTREGDWRSLVLLGVALIIPSVVWLVSSKLFGKPSGAWWWVIVGAAIIVGLWGTMLVPEGTRPAFIDRRWG
ncbi:hypothetical protein JZY91_07885 [Corynebacterium sp. CNCTC7651]|uniref:hypothetical protein n=1 Tax=Corynebacterium sp. CNCTC7651 TaxID=2815361 RepID=UPI001F2A6FD7|nr:hypothetical protein [Corynebacterium sp. CNCTC7651]UIZ91656.1 hypothetical protein JZY91_07885 [Corynebacterium sp. CNCTC7651]